MIERICGKLIKVMPSCGVVDVNGVGYGVEMPLSVIAELPEVGSEITLWIHTHVREDALKLYGFLEYGDRLAFEILLQLNGVGPKMALATLSTLSVAALCRTVEIGSKDSLQQVPGVGARKAEKILVELKAKLPRLQGAISGLAGGASGISLPAERLDVIQGGTGVITGPLHDVRSALENLGFKEKQIDPVCKFLAQDMPNAPFQEMLRVALRKLAKPLNESGDLAAISGDASNEGRDSTLY